MPSIQQVIQHLALLAPPAYQESYDNARLLVGNPSEEALGIICSLDATEAVVDEAIAQGCNLIVAHHPIIFSGLKQLTGATYIERTVMKAIKHDIAIYAIHTNLDNVLAGVNARICQKLGLVRPQILVPKRGLLRKLTVFVPHENKEALLNALGNAGAGQIGNYKNCSFQVSGTGTFMPTEAAHPHVGEANKLEQVEEARLEVIFPAYLENSVLKAMRQAHPYEEVAYYLHALENAHQEVGAGMIAELESPMDEQKFLLFVKERMGAGCVKHTKLLGKPIRKVAVCGGAGSFLLGKAIAAGADLFITADYKYHEFFDAEGKIVIADIGHYESEQFTQSLLLEYLQQQFPDVEMQLTEVNTNPVYYC